MARNRQRAKQRRARRDALGIPNPAEQPVAKSTDAGDEIDAASKTDGVAATGAASDGARPAESASSGTSAKAAKSKSAASPVPRQRGRLRAFLRSSWAELRRVQWPDRRQVTTLTGIVIGFVALAGAYLGVIDVIANKLVDLII